MKKMYPKQRKNCAAFTYKYFSNTGASGSTNIIFFNCNIVTLYLEKIRNLKEKILGEKKRKENPFLWNKIRGKKNNPKDGSIFLFINQNIFVECIF